DCGRLSVRVRTPRASCARLTIGSAAAAIVRSSVTVRSSVAIVRSSPSAKEGYTRARGRSACHAGAPMSARCPSGRPHRAGISSLRAHVLGAAAPRGVLALLLLARPPEGIALEPDAPALPPPALYGARSPRAQEGQLL